LRSFAAIHFFDAGGHFSEKNASSPNPARQRNGFLTIQQARGLDCGEHRLIVKNR
jgi:hypothetical protein